MAKAEVPIISAIDLYCDIAAMTNALVTPISHDAHPQPSFTRHFLLAKPPSRQRPHVIAAPARIMVYDWDRHQQTCYRLYIDEGKSLEDIRAHLRSAHGFAPR